MLSRWIASLPACHSGSGIYELFLSTKVDNESFISIPQLAVIILVKLW